MSACPAGAGEADCWHHVAQAGWEVEHVLCSDDMQQCVLLMGAPTVAWSSLLLISVPCACSRQIVTIYPSLALTL